LAGIEFTMAFRFFATRALEFPLSGEVSLGKIIAMETRVMRHG
jgi:hypothetical protein